MGLVFGYLFIAPYLAVYNLRRALLQQDVDGIQDGIDFPTLRASVKEELNSVMAKSLKSDDTNGFAVLGATFATALSNSMIDNYLTPKVIAGMSKSGNSDVTPGQAEGFLQAISLKDPNVSYGYESLGRFTVLINHSTKLVWLRSGLMNWRLSEIHLPTAN